MGSSGTSAQFLTSSGLGSLCAAFVFDSIEAMIPWIFSMFAVVACDLVSGIARCYKTGVTVRFSKAIRDTFMKATSYFFTIVAFCMVDVTTYGEYGIAKIVCLTLCVIEGCSIISNILKWHGYSVNFNKVIGLVLKQKYDIAIDESDGIIEKDRISRRKRKQ